MSALFTAFALGAANGLIHAFGSDHCAAMATLGTMARPKASAIVLTGVKFALGHAVILGGVTAVSLVAGVGVSHTFEQRTEVAGGVLLIVLAAAALIWPELLRHGHPHSEGHVEARGRSWWGRGSVPIVVGAMLALSGVRALMLAVPPFLAGTQNGTAGWLFLPGFVGGVIVGMSAVGFAIAHVVDRSSSRVAVWLQRTAAMSTAAVGLLWVGSWV